MMGTHTILSLQTDTNEGLGTHFPSRHIGSFEFSGDYIFARGYSREPLRAKVMTVSYCLPFGYLT
jgi:hypothetical protein